MGIALSPPLFHRVASYGRWEGRAAPRATKGARSRRRRKQQPAASSSREERATFWRLPPPAPDWDAPAPYKGNLAMLLQAMIATEDGPAAALAAAMMAETKTPMAPPEALVA